MQDIEEALEKLRKENTRLKADVDDVSKHGVEGGDVSIVLINHSSNFVVLKSYSTSYRCKSVLSRCLVKHIFIYNSFIVIGSYVKSAKVEI